MDFINEPYRIRGTVIEFVGIKRGIPTKRKGKAFKFQAELRLHYNLNTKRDKEKVLNIYAFDDFALQFQKIDLGTEIIVDVVVGTFGSSWGKWMTSAVCCGLEIVEKE